MITACKVEGKGCCTMDGKIIEWFWCRQFAQRSRVRKLQYIAELERNVQALQARITEVDFIVDLALDR